MSRQRMWFTVVTALLSNGSSCTSAGDCSSGYCGNTGKCTACSSDGNCKEGVLGTAGGQYCSSTGVCMARKADGLLCPASSQCSGPGCNTARQCIDGCCDALGFCHGYATGDRLCAVGSRCDDGNACHSGGTVSSTLPRTCAGATSLADGTSCDPDSTSCSQDACNAGACTHVAANAGVTCRPAAGACDVAETCNGTQTACPADVLQSSSVTCRAAAGPCDAAETCTGTSAACPADGFLSSTTVCRPAATPCDAQETCPGSSASCPADAQKPLGASCNDGDSCTSSDTCNLGGTCSGVPLACNAPPSDCYVAAGTCTNGTCSYVPKTAGAACADDGNPCTTDLCDGAGACTHAPGNATAVCRPAAGVCDVAETCTGTSSACPADVLVPSSAICRASQSGCDPQEVCTGSSAACPADVTTPDCADVTLTTPHGWVFQDVTLGATAGITLDLGASAMAVARPAVLTDMASGTDLGINLLSHATSGTAFASSTITLQSGATLTGNAVSPSVVVLPGATVAGTVDQSTPLTPFTVKKFTAIFPSTPQGDVLALPLIPRSLDPGRYDNVTVSFLGTLRLHSGSYYFDTLTAPGTSKIEIDDSEGPVFVFTRLGFSIDATMSSTSGTGMPTLTIVDIGVLPVHLGTNFRGAVAAPSAALELGGIATIYQGTFYGNSIHVLPGVIVKYEPPNNLTGLFYPGSKGLVDCVAALRAPDGPVSPARDAQYQIEIAKHCTAPDASSCLQTLFGRSNADYAAAALRTVNHTLTPSQYLAVTRDRHHKVTQAEADPAYADSLCAGPDSDNDWVVDSQDNCPNTPDLIAVDDSGCPLTQLPPAPSISDIDTLVQNTHILFNPLCKDAPAPETVSGVAMWQTFNPDDGMFIVSSRVTNQPPGCTVWYIFQVLENEGRSGPAFTVAFPDTKAVAHVGDFSTLPLVPPNFIQFLAHPTDPDTIGRLGALAGTSPRIRFRVQAVNGAGQRGQWSDWHTPAQTDCLQLGVHCQE